MRERSHLIRKERKRPDHAVKRKLLNAFTLKQYKLEIMVRNQTKRPDGPPSCLPSPSHFHWNYSSLFLSFSLLNHYKLLEASWNIMPLWNDFYDPRCRMTLAREKKKRLFIRFFIFCGFLWRWKSFQWSVSPFTKVIRICLLVKTKQRRAKWIILRQYT